MPEAILALDVGTSGCRAELLTPSGHSLGRSYREYGLLCPVAGAAEQAPEQWWEAICTCTRGALAEAGSVRVLAIGLSVQGHSWLPVDADRKPLRPALTWLDARSGEFAGQLLEKHGAEYWGRMAGKLPGQWHLLPQLLWLRTHESDIISRARYYLLAHDYLLARLTGELTTDPTLAAGTLLFDVERWAWSADLLAAYDIAPSCLAPVRPAGEVGGALTAEAAGQLGLDEGIPVAVGAQDQKCAALAAGLDETTATASLGTATALMARVPQPRFQTAAGAIPCFPYLAERQWVLEAPLSTSGGALRWLRDLLAAGGSLSYADLMTVAERVPPGCEGVGFLPYLAGAGAPWWRGEACGAFTGLSLRTGPGHLTRACLEAVACDLRANLDFMRELGCDLQRLRLFGGGTRSDLWPSIIAAVCGLPTERCPEAEAAVRGAAMLAAQSVGLDPAPLCLPCTPVAPVAGWQEAYQDVYPAYRRQLDRYWVFSE